MDEGKVDQKTMRKIHIIGIAFAAVFAFSMVSASGASAFTLWDECLKTATVLEFKDNDCTSKVAPLEWGWLEITVKKDVESLLTILKLSSNGITIECEGFSLGTVGPGSADEVTEVLSDALTNPPIECPVTAGLLACGNDALATPENLPWKTELVAAGDLLEKGAWLVECLTGLTNLCENANAILKVTNLEAELEVDLEFDPTEKVLCTTGEGKVEGTVPILLESEVGLRAM